MREQRDFERLKFGGYSHVVDEINLKDDVSNSPYKKGSPSVRTNLMKTGVGEPKFNDFMNNVFHKPTPPAHVLLAEK